MKNVIVVVDESALPANPGEHNNPGKGGGGALMLEVPDLGENYVNKLISSQLETTRSFTEMYPEIKDILNVREVTQLVIKVNPYTTQNRVCLMTICAVLDYYKEPANLLIVLDSQNTARTFRKTRKVTLGISPTVEYFDDMDCGWLFNWYKSDWEKGKKNLDLWKKIISLMGVKVSYSEWEQLPRDERLAVHRIFPLWVSAHTIDGKRNQYGTVIQVLNKKADQLALLGCTGNYIESTGEVIKGVDDVGLEHAKNHTVSSGMLNIPIPYYVFGVGEVVHSTTETKPVNMPQEATGVSKSNDKKISMMDFRVSGTFKKQIMGSEVYSYTDGTFLKAVHGAGGYAGLANAYAFLQMEKLFEDGTIPEGVCVEICVKKNVYDFLTDWVYGWKADDWKKGMKKKDYSIWRRVWDFYVKYESQIVLTVVHK